MALASLTQPVGQAVYGVLFDVFSACPAGVLLGAGAVSAVFLTGAMRHETENAPADSSAWVREIGLAAILRPVFQQLCARMWKTGGDER